MIFKPATPETHPDLITVVDGVELLSAKAMSLLCGVDEDEVRAVLDRRNPDGTVPLPCHWRRQAKEISAQLGIDDAMQILAIRAAQSGGES